MEIKIPEIGESVREALLAKWLKSNDDMVLKNEPLCEIETHKITLDLSAEEAGKLIILVPEGATVPIGTVIGTIITDPSEVTEPLPETELAPREQIIMSVVSSPAARREMRASGIDPVEVVPTGRGGRIMREDVLDAVQGKLNLESGQDQPSPSSESDSFPSPPAQADAKQDDYKQEVPVVALPKPAQTGIERGETRVAMTPIRRKIAERLLAARQQTAMLTTFNEADLSQIQHLREKHRDYFTKRHGSGLGLMPFFVKACVQALKEFAAVNARIDGNDIVYHDYCDIGIAIGADKGLVVPVLRNAERLRLFGIDQAISEFVNKIRNKQLSVAELEGGTFTISNGGVYGSLLSTPILNPPQSAVLGMHAIQERAVVRDGQIVIRPMMYLALSYDHRIIDGREAVGFLRRIKEYVEEPEELLLEG